MNTIPSLKTLARCCAVISSKSDVKLAGFRKSVTSRPKGSSQSPSLVGITPRSISFPDSLLWQGIHKIRESKEIVFDSLCAPLSKLKIEDCRIRREISDPLSKLKIDITPPPRQKKQDCILPNLREEECVEPPRAEIFEKKAARLIVIRRAKMKKHKWKKLQKRMKFEFAKRRQKRELAKEKIFQALLLSKIKEAEQWSAEEYVANKIKTAAWERPITHLRGYFAPDSVIKEHLNEEEEKRKIAARIQECIRFKNNS